MNVADLDESDRRLDDAIRRANLLPPREASDIRRASLMVVGLLFAGALALTVALTWLSVR